MQDLLCVVKCGSPHGVTLILGVIRHNCSLTTDHDCYDGEMGDIVSLIQHDIQVHENSTLVLLNIIAGLTAQNT